jgi:hypothetical protein
MRDEQTIIVPDTPPFDELAVITWFGMAVLTAQRLEEALEIFVAVLRLVEWPSPLSPPPEIGLASIQVWDRKTMGRVLIDVKKFYEIDPLLNNLLMKALTKRNHLIHRFQSSNKVKWKKEKGRTELVGELQAIIKTFYNAADSLFALSDGLMQSFKITRTAVREERAKFDQNGKK